MYKRAKRYARDGIIDSDASSDEEDVLSSSEEDSVEDEEEVQLSSEAFFDGAMQKYLRGQQIRNERRERKEKKEQKLLTVEDLAAGVASQKLKKPSKKAQKADSDGESSDDEEGSEAEADEEEEGERQGGDKREYFECSLCPDRVLRCMQDVQDHINSKYHKRRERWQKRSTRTLEDKLKKKKKNAAKRARKEARIQAEKESQAKAEKDTGDDSLKKTKLKKAKGQSPKLTSPAKATKSPGKSPGKSPNKAVKRKRLSGGLEKGTPSRKKKKTL